MTVVARVATTYAAVLQGGVLSAGRRILTEQPRLLRAIAMQLNESLSAARSYCCFTFGLLLPTSITLLMLLSLKGNWLLLSFPLGLWIAATAPSKRSDETTGPHCFRLGSWFARHWRSVFVLPCAAIAIIAVALMLREQEKRHGIEQLFVRAESLLRNSSAADALAVLNALEIDEDDNVLQARKSYDTAVALLLHGEEEDAKDALRRAVRLYSGHIPAHSLLSSLGESDNQRSR